MSGQQKEIFSLLAIPPPIWLWILLMHHHASKLFCFLPHWPLWFFVVWAKASAKLREGNLSNQKVNRHIIPCGCVFQLSFSHYLGSTQFFTFLFLQLFLFCLHGCPFVSPFHFPPLPLSQLLRSPQICNEIVIVLCFNADNYFPFGGRAAVLVLFLRIFAMLFCIRRYGAAHHLFLHTPPILQYTVAARQ